jgi:salicylate hydroxylase
MPVPDPVPSPLHVVVVGGGLGGVTAAVVLGKAGLKVDIFEQAPAFAEIGAGIK